MNLVSSIILLFLCIGVTYSSPTSNSSSDTVSAVKPSPVVPKVQLDHNKVQTSPPTQTLHPVAPTTSTITNSSVKVDESVTVENKTRLPLVIGNKNVTNEAKNTSTSDVIPKQNTTSSRSSTSAPIQTTILTQRSTVTTTAASSATSTSSTAAPVVSISDHTVPTPTAQERQFDGPSFVGGIVLTVGLTAIGFIAFKFYKSGKIERNYRTL